MTSDRDLDVTRGELSWVRGIAAVRQNVEIGLRTFLGECVYDRNAGVPYIQIIFQKGVTTTAILLIIDHQIRMHDGVLDVRDLAASVDRDARVVHITGRIRCGDGEFPLDITEAATG